MANPSNFPNRPFRLEASAWLLSQDVGANTSRVRAQLWIRKNSYSPTFSGDPSSYEFFVNGNRVATNSFTYDFRNSDALLLAQVDVTVPHDNDGAKEISIEAYCNAAVLGYTQISTPMGLPQIPRASNATFTGGAEFDAGSPVTIQTNRKVATYTHNLTWAFGTLSGQEIASGVGASTSWTPPLSMLSQIPNATAGIGTVTLKTYSGSTLVGTTTVNFILRVPASVAPTVTQLAAADLNPDVAAIVGKFVQGLSRAKLTVTGAGAYGSTITAAEATLLGSTVATGGDIALTQAGTLQAVGKVTDTRGRTGSANGTLSVLPYAPPSVTVYQARRCTSAGTVQDDGAYLRVDLTAAISSLINTTERNALTIRAFTRPRGSGAWTARNVITPAGMTYNTWFLMSGGGIFTTTGSWDVRVEVADKFGKYIADTTVSTISVTMDLNGKNVGIGKIWERYTVDIAGDAGTSGDFYHRGGYPVEPVGIVTAFAGTTAPAGWLLCDGSAVSRTTYAALFAALGTAYGVGNGTSTFNLPDLRGRVPVGRDTTQTEFDVLGESGGAKTHTLTLEQLPVPGTNTDGFVVHRTSLTGGGFTTHLNSNGAAGSDAYSYRNGGGQPHNNLQPYLVLNHIIKAL